MALKPWCLAIAWLGDPLNLSQILHSPIAHSVSLCTCCVDSTSLPFLATLVVWIYLTSPFRSSRSGTIAPIAYSCGRCGMVSAIWRIAHRVTHACRQRWNRPCANDQNSYTRRPASILRTVNLIDCVYHSWTHLTYMSVSLRPSCLR